MSCRSARATVVGGRYPKNPPHLARSSFARAGTVRRSQAHRIDLGVMTRARKKRSSRFATSSASLSYPNTSPALRRSSALARSTLTVFRPTSELSRRAKASSASPNPPEGLVDPVVRAARRASHLRLRPLARRRVHRLRRVAAHALGGRAAQPVARPQTPQERLLALPSGGYDPCATGLSGTSRPRPRPRTRRGAGAQTSSVEDVFSFSRDVVPARARDPPPRARLPAPPRARPRGART